MRSLIFSRREAVATFSFNCCISLSRSALSFKGGGVDISGVSRTLSSRSKALATLLLIHYLAVTPSVWQLALIAWFRILDWAASKRGSQYVQVNSFRLWWGEQVWWHHLWLVWIWIHDNVAHKLVVCQRRLGVVAGAECRFAASFLQLLQSFCPGVRLNSAARSLSTGLKEPRGWWRS